MDIEKEMSDRAERIEKIIRSYLPEEDEQNYYDNTVRLAMNYSVLAGGKRLRPMLMEASFLLFGGQGEAVWPFMAAMEMIHTYSLVHDDLPAMDNDEYRRGKKTTHAVYGEAMGILAGDGLLNYAYETVAKAISDAACGQSDSGQVSRMARAFAVLSTYAGINGMVGGQVVDVESENLDPSEMTEEKLAFIYEKKTGALIQASLMIGAILAGADDTSVEQMREAGSLLGRAFQIQDDILDMTSSLEVLGKPIGSDERNHKVTYVTLWGMEHAVDEVNRLSQEAVRLLDGFSGDSTFLRELFCYLIHRER